MRFINNQPVSFETPQHAFLDQVRYAQLVKQGDITQFQVISDTDINTDQLLANPDFALNLNSWYQTGTGSWYQQNGKAVISGTQGGTLIQDVLTASNFYRVEISISVLYYGRIDVSLGGNTIGEITEPGTYVFSGVSGSSPSFWLNGTPLYSAGAGVRIAAYVDFVTIYNQTQQNYIFALYDEDGTYRGRVPAIASYLDDPITLNSAVQRFANIYTVSVDWNGLGIGDGCYRIGILDADINTNSQNGIYNGEFALTNKPGWDLTTVTNATLQITGANLVYTGTAGLGSAAATQTNLVKSGNTYLVKMNITAITNTDVVVKFGTQTSATFTTTGVKAFTITANGTNLDIDFTATGAGDLCTIDYIRVEAQTGSYEPDHYSNYFQLETTILKPNSLINAHNSFNAFGLNFENMPWSPRLRFEAYLSPLDNPYEIDQEDVTNWDGERDKYFFDSRKAMAFAVVGEPLFIHDFLRCCMGYDHFYIDGVEYVITDDSYPTIQWNKYRTKGAVVFEVQEKVQTARNVRKGADTGGFDISTTENGGGKDFLGIPAQMPDNNAAAAKTSGTDSAGALRDPDELTQQAKITAERSQSNNEPGA